MDTENQSERFAIEVDGEFRSVHDSFADAVKAGLFIQNALPTSKVSIRSLYETSGRAAA